MKLSRPKDKTVEAFKKWVLSVYEDLTGKKAEDFQSEEKWEEDCKKFWGSHSNEKYRDGLENGDKK